MKFNNKKFKKLLIAFIAMAIICAAFLTLVLTKTVKLNKPSEEQYPIKGVDVSAYQGDIDWPLLAQQDIQFAFIKATEGSSFVDEKFAYNYEQAQSTDLRISAYHFFSYDSSGKTQAENFIANVPITDNMLPPVIDVEFYGDKEQNLPDAQTTRQELDVMIEMLAEHYGLEPIIYATQKAYRLYIKDYYPDNDIWIRNVYIPPILLDDKGWVFWQYTDTAKLEGYKGEEQYIDINVFYGTQAQFDEY